MNPMTSPLAGNIRSRASGARTHTPGSRAALCLLAAIILFAGPAAPAQTAPPAVTIAATFTGQVQDATGAIVPNARIEIRRSNGAVVATTLSDGAGQFHLAQPPDGDYRLSIAVPGFEPLTRPLHVTHASLAPLTLTLKLASVSTNVTVNASADIDVASPDNNKDTPTITSDDMKTLPILDGDVVATLSAFLDAGVAGEGGTTLIVDGVEMKTAGVSPSAIERVSINQDPYSAQYRQPGKGQVEIITKSTADRFHGAFTFTFRDSVFNASNYYAKTKPPDQRRTYEGYLTGPIKPLTNTTFLFSANRREQSFTQQVNANTAPGITTAENVPAPATNTSP